MSDLDRLGRWLERKWVTVALIVFAVFCLVQAFQANANKACANLCNPYAPDLRAGACYCHTEKVAPDALEAAP